MSPWSIRATARSYRISADAQEKPRLHLPGWLDPWWRDQQQIVIPLQADHILARLQASAGISAALSARGNELIVMKRGRYLGGYVRTVAKLANRDAETEVTVTFGRSSATAWIMVGFEVLAVVVPLVEWLPQILTNGLWAWSSLWFFYFPVMMAIVLAVNHSSTQADVRDLRAIIEAALTQPPRWLWQTLGNA